MWTGAGKIAAFVPRGPARGAVWFRGVPAVARPPAAKFSRCKAQPATVEAVSPFAGLSRFGTPRGFCARGSEVGAMDIRWSPALAVGHPEIDRQHQELFRRAGALVDALRGASAPRSAGSSTSWRATWSSTSAPRSGSCSRSATRAWACHRAEHLRFVRDYRALRGLLDGTGPVPALTVKTRLWLAGWLERHIGGADRRLAITWRSASSSARPDASSRPIAQSATRCVGSPRQAAAECAPLLGLRRRTALDRAEPATLDPILDAALARSPDRTAIDRHHSRSPGAPRRRERRRPWSLTRSRPCRPPSSESWPRTAARSPSASSAPAPSSGSRPSPSTRRRTASPSTATRRTRRTSSARARRPSTPTSASRRSSRSRSGSRWTPSTPATASSPRTPDFSEACERAGIAFVGPTAEMQRRLGDKVAGRKAAPAAGVPVVPGTAEPIAPRRGGARLRAGPRLPHHRQGERGRRRPRHARRARPAGARRGARLGAERGPRGVREPGRLPRALHRAAEAHRGADPRRPPRQPRPPVRARLLHPAAAPEGGRVRALAGALRGAARRPSARTRSRSRGASSTGTPARWSSSSTRRGTTTSSR